MIRPSLDQIGMSRSRPNGRRRRERTGVAPALLRPLAHVTALLSAPEGYRRGGRAGHRTSSDPAKGRTPRFHHAPVQEESPGCPESLRRMGCSWGYSPMSSDGATHGERPNCPSCSSCRPLWVRQVVRSSADRATGAVPRRFLQRRARPYPAPRSRQVDWESPESWDADGSCRCDRRIGRRSEPNVPVYDISSESTDRLIGRSSSTDRRCSWPKGSSPPRSSSAAGSRACWPTPSPLQRPRDGHLRPPPGPRPAETPQAATSPDPPRDPALAQRSAKSCAAKSTLGCQPDDRPRASGAAGQTDSRAASRTPA